MKILITGGAGFIGQKLSRHLHNLSHEVSILDLENKLQKLEKFTEQFSIDISNFDSLQKNLPTDYDVIIHCAAQTGGYYSLVDPQLDCSWNALGTLNIVQFSKSCCKQIKKIIYTSSMAVYGEGRNKNENSDLLPISNYGVSKLAGENYVKLGWHHSSIPYTIFRLWNTYGAGQDLQNKFQGMLSIYLAQALKTNIIKITGSKNRIRDFIHVDDVISAIELSLTSEKTDNQIYNVCCGEEHTSEQVISEIARQLNKSLSIEEIQGYVGDQQFSSGENYKLRNIGWSPRINLQTGIKKFIDNI